MFDEKKRYETNVNIQICTRRDVLPSEGNRKICTFLMEHEELIDYGFNLIFQESLLK